MQAFPDHLQPSVASRRSGCQRLDLTVQVEPHVRVGGKSPESVRLLRRAADHRVGSLDKTYDGTTVVEDRMGERTGYPLGEPSCQALGRPAFIQEGIRQVEDEPRFRRRADPPCDVGL